MQVTAAAVDMFFTLASTARAAAGPRKAIVWICFLTFLAGTPGNTTNYKKWQYGHVSFVSHQCLQPGEGPGWMNNGHQMHTRCHSAFPVLTEPPEAFMKSHPAWPPFCLIIHQPPPPPPTPPPPPFMAINTLASVSLHPLLIS